MSQRLVIKIGASSANTTKDHEESLIANGIDRSKKTMGSEGSEKVIEGPEEITRRAKIYQEHMKRIPIPSPIPNTLESKTWEQLALSMEELYKQPLHYLTFAMVKEWDKSRIGAEDEKMPVGEVINPLLAQATIWFIEQVHRRTTSPQHLVKLWLSDPTYLNFC